MKNRFRVFHLAAICVALFLTGAARMSGQNGQALRITKGPILEEVTSDSAVIAWSTNMQGSTNVMYGSDPRNLSRLAEAPTYCFRIETGEARGGHGQEVENYNLRSFTTTARGAAPLHEVAPRIE
jgi:hypothetical protein